MTAWAAIFLAVTAMAAPFALSAELGGHATAEAAQILVGVFASLFIATATVKLLSDRF